MLMSFESPEEPADRGDARSAWRGALAVDVQRRDDVAVVRACGELDVATVGKLRGALDGIEDAARLVLDLRGLSFIDSTGLHLVVALDKRAQRDGFELALIAPAAPVDRAFRICALDKTLPFADAAA
jgi:anti-sigma B factor antagonist